MTCIIRKVDSAPQIQSTGCLGDVVFVALVRHKGQSESARSIIKIALQGDSFCCRVNSFSSGVGAEGRGKKGGELEMGQGSEARQVCRTQVQCRP